MLEPDEGKLSRPVLRRGAGSNPGSLAGVSFINRFCRLTEIMEVAELVGNMGEDRRDGTTDGQLAVLNDADNRHLHGLTHRPEQSCQVRLGR